MNPSIFEDLRSEFHRKICQNILGLRPGSSGYTVSDSSSRSSKDFAARMVAKIGYPTCTDPKTGQTAGSLFGHYTMEFLQAAFERLQHLRPGEWIFSASQAPPGIAAFDQYEHLAELQRVIRKFRELSTAFGGDYIVTPDIIIARRPVTDSEINARENLIGAQEKFSTHTSLRKSNYENPRAILHASISCKWTIRSDRAQNTRTEALNLIRNRKGKTPHIVAVTFEPLPTRLASIALGTGDVDCTYHGALYELMEAVDEAGNQDQAEMLHTLVKGRRLRDISDLPFDLAS